MSKIRSLFDGRVVLHCGDCLDVLAAMPVDSVDSVVTDPPYHLTSPAVGWETMSNGKGGTKAGVLTKRGFMGNTWDGGDIAFRSETWAAVLRVLKPGGHMFAFAAPRNQHRMVCAIEDAGFEIRDQFQWIFGSGFPKSLNISKQIDIRAGAVREVVGTVCTNPAYTAFGDGEWAKDRENKPYEVTASVTPEAKQWEGWYSNVKPAYEPISLARKPLDGTIAANVLKHGTGGINIDGCRIHAEDAPEGRRRHGGGIPGNGTSYEMPDSNGAAPAGRWPSNIIHDGSDEVKRMFPQTIGSKKPTKTTSKFGGSKIYGGGNGLPSYTGVYAAGGSGSAARYFQECPFSDEEIKRIYYSRKADLVDRAGSNHATVKPVSLMRYLVRLITPPGAIVLDPFAGTGTTGEAAELEGMRALLIEKQPQYQDDIEARMKKIDSRFPLRKFMVPEAPKIPRERMRPKRIKLER